MCGVRFADERCQCRVFRSSQVVDKYLEDYNMESKTQMPLVMFRFAIEHATRISRIISMPGGNMLLVGVGGSGRQSLSRLAAYMADYELFQIEISKNYNREAWFEDLKEVIKGAGTGSRPWVFLFSDVQIKYPSPSRFRGKHFF